MNKPFNFVYPALILGSGRRRRRAFDPNAWSASIPSKRTNVLCLGVSYPCAKSQIRQELDTKVKIIYAQESVEQAIELVRRNVMTQMDGRDLARCLALESSNDTLAYTVSLESGATYSYRHINANFNRPNFIESLKRKWGKTIKFRQIILDYFWIPRGSWVMTHWTKTFFATTLPGFVTSGILDYSNGPVVESDYDFSPSGTGGGVVYLPFCLHCVKQIVAHIDTLAEYYHISFLAKWELSEHALWAGTSTIDPDSMQNWLGKAINQEDIYCTFTPREFHYSTDDAHVCKEDILNVLNGIENFVHIRMIKLKGLPRYNPTNLNKTASNTNSKLKRKKRLTDYIHYETDLEQGGFIGLKKPDELKCGFDQYAKTHSLTKILQKPYESSKQNSDTKFLVQKNCDSLKAMTKKQNIFNSKDIKKNHTCKKKSRVKNQQKKKTFRQKKEKKSTSEGKQIKLVVETTPIQKERLKSNSSPYSLYSVDTKQSKIGKLAIKDEPTSKDLNLTTRLVDQSDGPISKGGDSSSSSLTQDKNIYVAVGSGTSHRTCEDSEEKDIFESYQKGMNITQNYAKRSTIIKNPRLDIKMDKEFPIIATNYVTDKSHSLNVDITTKMEIICDVIRRMKYGHAIQRKSGKDSFNCSNHHSFNTQELTELILLGESKTTNLCESPHEKGMFNLGMSTKLLSLYQQFFKSKVSFGSFHSGLPSRLNDCNLNLDIVTNMFANHDVSRCFDTVTKLNGISFGTVDCFEDKRNELLGYNSTCLIANERKESDNEEHSKLRPLRYYLNIEHTKDDLVYNGSWISYCHKAYYTPPKKRFKRKYEQSHSEE